MSRRLLILGAGGHGRAVADLAAEAGWTVAGFTDRGSRAQVLGTDRDVGALARAGTIDAGVIVAEGLTGTERVVTTAGGFLREGETVTIAPPPAPAEKAAQS